MRSGSVAQKGDGAMICAILMVGWDRGTLRGVGAGDEGGTAEDVLLRAPGLAVCAAGFGEGPIHGGLDQDCAEDGIVSSSLLCLLSL